MKVDILLCIDGTRSMHEVISQVKENITIFVNKIASDLTSNGSVKVRSVRVKILVFRNADADGDEWLEQIHFLNLEDHSERIDTFFQSITAKGGSTKSAPEDALMALSNALYKWNWDSNKRDVRIVALWSDTESKNITPGHERLLKGAPSSLGELKSYWISRFTTRNPKTRLLLFTPDCYPWNIIDQEWPCSVHYKSPLTKIKGDYKNLDLVDRLLRDLTPDLKEFEEDVIDPKKLDSKRKIRFLQSFRSRFKKYKKIAVITFAIFSISLISFRIVGFSFFNFNINIASAKNDVNTEELARRLNEVTLILKEEGLFNEGSEINYSSEIVSRNGWFKDEYDLILRYTFNFSLENFELGQYSLEELNETFVAAEVVADQLNVIEDTYQHDGPIDVKVIGETDATLIGDDLIYRGEFGGNLETYFTYEIAEMFFKKNQGERIRNNTELGVLRAIGFWTYLKGKTNLFIPKETNIKFQSVTNSGYGKEYRKTTLILRLYDLNKIRE